MLLVGEAGTVGGESRRCVGRQAVDGSPAPSASSASSGRPASASACSANGRVFRLVYAPQGRDGRVGRLPPERHAHGGRPAPARRYRACSSTARASSRWTRTSGSGSLEASREHQRHRLQGPARAGPLGASRTARGFQTPIGSRSVASSVVTRAIYAGLVSVMMRMVFVLFAGRAGPVAAGVRPLRERVLADASPRASSSRRRIPTARRWTSVRRLGAGHRALSRSTTASRAVDGLFLPPRHGSLFDPGAYPFLEGRAPGSPGALSGPLDCPGSPMAPCSGCSTVSSSSTGSASCIGASTSSTWAPCTRASWASRSRLPVGRA